MPDGSQHGSQNRSASKPIDWGPVVDRILAGDRTAYARLVRLVTSHLAHWRADDFRADWDDMVQEVLISVVGAYREGRLDAPGALQAYLRQATRFRFIDRIRASKHRDSSADPQEILEQRADSIPWPPGQSIQVEALEIARSLAQAVDALPERERLAVLEVHVRGRTYEEAAEFTGIPLGSLKRSLRDGLARLRRGLERADREI